MKKLLSLLAIVAFVSCNSGETATEAPAADTTAPAPADTTAAAPADTTAAAPAADTTAVAK